MSFKSLINKFRSAKQPAAHPSGLTPLSTEIVQTKVIGDYTVVLEEYKKFQKESNLYCVDKSGSIVWFAELPSENDIYPGKFKVKGNQIETNSWNCYSVLININTGVIEQRHFTK